MTLLHMAEFKSAMGHVLERYKAARTISRLVLRANLPQQRVVAPICAARVRLSAQMRQVTNAEVRPINA